MAWKTISDLLGSTTIRKYRPCFILLRLVTISLFARGGHIAGSEIGYHMTGSGTLDVYYSIYTDDTGGCPGAFSPIAVKSDHCSDYFNVILQLVTPTGIRVETACNSGINLSSGFTKWTYQGTVALPFACDDWKLSANECCRSSSITSIQDPGMSPVYTETWINNLSASNMLLSFDTQPTFIVWSNQTNRRFVMTDHAGLDSVVITPIPTRMSVSDDVTYINGYSSSEPIRMTSPLQVERSSGIFTCTPLVAETGILTLRATGYLNGQAVTSIEREQRIIAVAPTNSLPEASGFDGTGSYTAEQCSGGLFHKRILLHDADAGTVPTLISWEGPAGMLLDVSGNSIQLEWNVPRLLHDTTFLLGIMISDQQCPVPGIQEYSYVLNVRANSLPSYFSPLIRDATCSNVADGSIELQTGGLQVTWSNGSTGEQLLHVAPGTYQATVTDPSSGCRVSLPAGVGFEHLAPQIDLGPDRIVCQGTQVLLEPGPAFESYDWSDGSDRESLEVSASGYYHVMVTDVFGCTGVSGTNIQFELCSGVGSAVSDLQLQIYPNPSNGFLEVKVPHTVEVSSWIITDDTGRTLLKGESPGADQTRIDTERLSAGVYLLTWLSEGGIRTIRFIRS